MFNPGISTLEGIIWLGLSILGCVACVWFFARISLPAVFSADKDNAEQAAADREKRNEQEAKKEHYLDNARTREAKHKQATHIYYPRIKDASLLENTQEDEWDSSAYSSFYDEGLSARNHNQ